MIIKTERTTLRGLLGIFSGLCIGNIIGVIFSFYFYNILNPSRLYIMEIISITICVFLCYKTIHLRTFYYMKQACPGMPDNAKCAIPLNMLLSVLFKRNNIIQK